MYNTMRHHFFRRHRANEVQTTVKDCHSCSQDVPKSKHKVKLQLFPAAEPFGFMAIDILGPLPRTTSDNQHVVIATGRYSKLTRATRWGEIASTHLATVFLYTWIPPNGIPSYVLTDNGPPVCQQALQDGAPLVRD